MIVLCACCGDAQQASELRAFQVAWRGTGDGVAQAVAHRAQLGWVAHYLIGIAFAAILVGIRGGVWFEHPTLVPALLVGVGTKDNSGKYVR